MVLGLLCYERLNGGRIVLHLKALGIATGAYEITLKYSKKKTFGKSFQSSNHFLIRICTAKLLVMKAACEKMKVKILPLVQWQI
jgi:alkylation response protein AidB-like acyl-CoA dehydrogenase